MKSKIFTLSILIIAFVGLSLKSAKAQYVTIPDANFATWLQANYPACMNGNLMDTTCSGIVNATVVYMNSLGISDLTGVSYFDNLQILTCSNNQLISLPPLPPFLTSLYCFNNSLTSLPSLPNTITMLRCENNYLTVLPTLPSSLTTLDCRNNELNNLPFLPNLLTDLICPYNLITSLPPLPGALTYLWCEDNQLVSLPALPNLLASLLCNQNQLTSLPILPSTLNALYCENNLLSFLPSLPTQLYDLKCDYNNILNLPTLPINLYWLTCTNNQLSSLPLLPNSLVNLFCSFNQISNLPSLPNALTQLYCNNNQLQTIPTLSPSLTALVCDNNLLTNLPAFPNTLQVLDCSYNQLTSLPVLPNSIQYLTCRNNQLTNFPLLPNSITAIECSYNQLSNLPNLPNAISQFRCYGNLIFCFPSFPQSLTVASNFNIAGNPFTCLPNYVTAMNAATLAIPLCNASNLNGCASSTGIIGKVYEDVNSNCNLDSTDSQMHNIKVKFYNAVTNQFGAVFSLTNGVFNYPANSGTYLVNVDTLYKPYQSNCTYPGIDSTVVTTISNPLANNINFDIKCKPGIDLNVQSIAHKSGMIFPGQQHTLQTMVGDASQWFGLNCAAGTSGQVHITLSGPITYNGIANGALIPTINGNIYSYTISDFGTINNLNDFQMLFTVDTTAQAGDQICVHVEVTSSTTDINPTNNIKDFCYSVVNSYDPNYKEVYPINVEPGFEDWLTYTIHFQNTGNAPAINIRLADTLDANLNMETFEVINYSHYNTVTLMDGIVDFRFPNILLPDSASDLAGSQGFVQYRIKPIANLPLGTQIKNTANIYFDFNAPITTNTTVNNFITVVGLNDILKVQNISIFPNPSNGIFNLSAQANIEVYNIVGELLLQSNNTKTIDLSNNPNGIYFVKMNGITTKKLMKN